MESAKLGILGDLFPTWCNEDLFARSEVDSLIDEEIKNKLGENDINICNLEGVFFDEENDKHKDGTRIKASTASVAGVKALGITAVSLANNHILDYGQDGYFSTIERLENFRIWHFGSGPNENEINDSFSFSRAGINVTVMSVSETLFNLPGANTPGANVYDEYKTCKRIAELKDKCDYLVVLYHGGMENFRFVTDSLRTRFHRMADSGADIIVSQHSHCIGLEEWYEGSYLLYGQGNFLFHFVRNVTTKNKSALMLAVEFTKEGFSIKKFRVDRSGPGMVMSDKQDLLEFKERSLRLAEGDNFEEEFGYYADIELNHLGVLEAFRGANHSDAMKKLNDLNGYSDYLISQYSTEQLYRIYKILQSEEFREITMRAVENIIDKRDGREDGIEPVVIGRAASQEEAEMMIAFRRYGTSVSEFEMFGFDNKSDEEREQYISIRNEKSVLKKAMQDSKHRDILKKKYSVYKLFGHYYGRDLIRCNDRDMFLEFSRKHRRFFLKSNEGTGGKGVKLIDLDEMKLSAGQLFDDHLRDGDFLVEEIIEQADEMGAIYSGSVNTVRTVTCLRNGEFKILFSTMRIGVGGNDMDTTSCGGYTVEIDSDAGVIISDAVSRKTEGFSHEHPDTGEVFRSRVIPRWEELVKIVEEAARQFPDPPIIGWDMALTPKGWVMVDVNWLPSFREIQVIRQKGQREFFERETGFSFAPNPRGY